MYKTESRMYMQQIYIDEKLHFPKRAWVEINLDAIDKNFDKILAHSKKTVIPVIKANAYGHGAVRVAKTLEDRAERGFAVSSIDEAEQLRNGGIEADILILG